MALMPVWTGVSTPWRVMTPGAMRSTGGRPGGGNRALVVERAAERVDHATDERRPDGDFDHAGPVVLTVSPSLMSVASPKMTAPDGLL